jgi:hypothetical protein
MRIAIKPPIFYQSSTIPKSASESTIQPFPDERLHLSNSPTIEHTPHQDACSEHAAC